MNLNKVDLNLFIVFDAIYTEANLTRAGQIVGITQPAVSNALARLRETFNDPLFVRTAQGMVPTPMAQNIIGPVRNALQLLRVSVQESRTFDARQANKTYRISMTDLSEQILLPPLFQRLRRLAPAVQIESFQAKRRETTKELAAGRLDFAVDAPLNTDPQVRHVKLMEDRYVCAMRKGHLGMLDFIETHLVDNGARLCVLLRQGTHMPVKMSLDLAFGFCQKAKIPFVAQDTGEDAHRQRAEIPQRV